MSSISSRAIHHDYMNGAIPVFERAARNVSNTIKDSAYNALPLPLKQVEAHISSMMGREPLLHQVNARTVLRREGASALISNPIGVTKEAALDIWNAFAENDGSVEGRKRAGAAGAELFLFAVAPLQLARALRPVPHTTTLHAGELGLGLQYASKASIKPDKDGLHVQVERHADVTKLPTFEMAPPLLFAGALADRWLSLGRSAQRVSPSASGDLRTLMGQLKRHAAMTGHQNLKIEAAFVNPRLENVFVRRYPQSSILQRNGYQRDATYRTSIPISEKFSQQVRKEHAAAVTQNAMAWHEVALAAQQPALPFSTLSVDLDHSTLASQEINSSTP